MFVCKKKLQEENKRENLKEDSQGVPQNAFRKKIEKKRWRGTPLVIHRANASSTGGGVNDKGEGEVNKSVSLEESFKRLFMSLIIIC